jgi:pimeloyl-ACP methyl ester carboxylesterase
VIIPDLPGCGETPAGEPPFTVAKHAEFLRSFVDRLGLGQHDVGGICLGATVALEYASRWHDRIARARETDSWWVRIVTSGVDSRYVLSLSQTLSRPDADALRPWSARPPVLGPRDIVASRTYSAWWPYGARTLYVLKRRGE